MSRREFNALQKSSNVVWMPTTLSEGSTELPTNQATQAYYRSQAFTANAGINPLISAAYPLLTLATRLSFAKQYHDLTHLHQMLLHEMKVFEHQAREKEYRQSVITIASYFICILLDDTILQCSWGQTWEHCSLLTALHHEESSKERIFHILDRLLQHPSQHLDVLELAYLCLSFYPQNANQQNPPTEILEKLDEIYHCIREERSEIAQGFLVQSPILPSNGSIQKQRGLSLFTTLLISTGIVAITYYIFSFSLKLLSGTLVQQLSLLNGN